MEIKILPDVSRENGWLYFDGPGEYRPWAEQHAPWVFDWSSTATAQGMACEYTLVDNGDTYMESLVFCRPEGPVRGGMWVLLVKQELSAVTALRMALRAFADLRAETGEGMPSTLEIAPE